MLRPTFFSVKNGCLDLFNVDLTPSAWCFFARVWFGVSWIAQQNGLDAEVNYPPSKVDLVHLWQEYGLERSSSAAWSNWQEVSSGRDFSFLLTTEYLKVRSLPFLPNILSIIKYLKLVFLKFSRFCLFLVQKNSFLSSEIVSYIIPRIGS